jgi:hypothetical protein
VLFPHISISFRFSSAIALPFNSFYPQFRTTSNTASSFTAALLTYAQYFLDKAQLLLPTAQPGSTHLAESHVVHPQHIKRRAVHFECQFSVPPSNSAQVINSRFYLSVIQSTATENLGLN